MLHRFASDARNPLMTPHKRFAVLVGLVVAATVAGGLLVVTKSACGCGSAPEAKVQPIIAGSTHVGGFLAHDKFVNPTAGNDHHAGSRASPYASIGKCASVIRPGHTCWLEGGDYTGANNAGICPAHSGRSDTSRVTFAAYPGQTPIMDGGGVQSSAFDCESPSRTKNYLTISGITITHYTTAGIELLHSLYPIIEHNTVHGISGADSIGGIYLSINQGVSSPSTPLIVSHNTVYDANGNPDTSDIWVGGGGPDNTNAHYTGASIDHNLTYGAGKDGIRVECGQDSTSLTVEDNISDHNRNAGIELNTCFPSSGIIVRNNFTGWDGASGIQAKHTANATFQNNTIYKAAGQGGFWNGDEQEGYIGCCTTNGGQGSGITSPGGHTCTLDGGGCQSPNFGLIVTDNIFSNDTIRDAEFTSGQYDLGTLRTCGDIDPSHLAVLAQACGMMFDYNTYYHARTDIWYVDGQGSLTTLSALRHLSPPYETHGVRGNPRFVSPGTSGGGNFTLRAGSAARGVSSSGGNDGADPLQCTGVGANSSYSLARVQ
jgi:hypothetical protein